jgi:predicted nucleic acid-binding protein
MPERPQLAIVDSTPIIALALVGKLDLLRRLYSQVVIPPAVQREVLAGGPATAGSAELQQATWIRVIPLQDTRRAEMLSDLDRGEAQVIALAQELGADLVIIDERLARRHTKRLGLTLTGTLGILLRSKSAGLIPSVAPLVEQLLRSGIHLSDSVVAEALRLAGEA